MREKQTDHKHREIMQRIVTALFSLVLAVFIWAYYGANYATEITRTFYGVEVTFNGDTALRESQNLVVSYQDTATVNVTLTGSRRDLAGLTSSDLKAVVNLSNVTTSGYRTMSYTISYPSSNYGSSIQVQSQSPETIGLQLSRLSTKYVAITGSFVGTVAEGYAISSTDMTFDPAYITLVGPEEELDEIADASVSIDRDNVSASFTSAANYTLMSADGDVLDFEDVTADTDVVNVTVPVNMTKDVALDVYLVEGGGATAANVTKTITPATVTLAGDPATLEGINTIYLASIDLSDYTSFPQTTYNIVLPNGTENLSGDTTATVDLAFTGLETRLFTVTNLEYVNLSDGYSAAIIDNTMVVNIRGTSDILDQIEATNIRAVADLTGLTATSRAPVTVYVDGFTDAGAVGDYYMYVRISPEADE